MSYYGVGLMETLAEADRLTNQLFDKRLQIFHELIDLGMILSDLPGETTTPTATPTPHKERAMPKARRNQNAQSSTPASTSVGSSKDPRASQSSSTVPSLGSSGLVGVGIRATITERKRQHVTQARRVYNNALQDWWSAREQVESLSPMDQKFHDAMVTLGFATENYLNAAEGFQAACGKV